VSIAKEEHIDLRWQGRQPRQDGLLQVVRMQMQPELKVLSIDYVRVPSGDKFQLVLDGIAPEYAYSHSIPDGACDFNKFIMTTYFDV
jgi:hypothetical protein